MTCIYCKGPLKPGKASHTETRNDCDLIFHNLPALICTRCQEPLFEEETVQAIQKVLASMDAHIAPLQDKAAA